MEISRIYDLLLLCSQDLTTLLLKYQHNELDPVKSRYNPSNKTKGTPTAPSPDSATVGGILEREKEKNWAPTWSQDGATLYTGPAFSVRWATVGHFCIP